MVKTVIILAVILVAIQFIPVDRTNPPVTQEIDVPENVLSIFKKSCYDCHSNETEYPWYAYVAPVSFLVAKDVNNGRRNINFSEWDKYSDKERTKIFEEIIEEIEDGEMPPGKYLLFHPDAEVSTSQLNILKKFVKGLNIKDTKESKIRYKNNDD